MERINENDLDYRDGDSGVKYFIRGPRIDWGVWRFLPGQSLKLHYHDEVEETFYFTKGSPKMIVQDEAFRIQPGDVVRLEPGERHDIINDTEEACEGAFIKSIYAPKDKVSVS